METFLEILKITIPALIVFLTVYFVMKSYLDKQYQLKVLEYRQSNQKSSLPLKMASYERLALFCERIMIPNLLLRLRADNQTVASLRVALMMGIQQEFEHNLSQQVYISEGLWNIIKFAKDDAINTIDTMADQLDGKAPAKELAGRLITFLSQQQLTARQQAQIAIRKEASLLL